MHTRIRYEIAGGHVHCGVFVGDAADHTHGKAGDLVLRRDEWEAFKLLRDRIPELAAAVELIETGT